MSRSKQNLRFFIFIGMLALSLLSCFSRSWSCSGVPTQLKSLMPTGMPRKGTPLWIIRAIICDV